MGKYVVKMEERNEVNAGVGADGAGLGATANDANVNGGANNCTDGKRKKSPGFYLLICVIVAIVVYLLLPNKPSGWWSPRPIQKPNSTAELRTINGLAQGSFYRVSYYEDEAVHLGEADFQKGIDSLLREFDQHFSLWNERSLLCQINRNEKVELDSMFIDLFEKSMQISAQTNGAFDITVAPLVKAYGFAKEAVQGHRLSVGRRDSLLLRIGYQKAKVQGGQLVKQHPDLQLDFNAIAQGYCADLVAGWLEGCGVSRYLVDIGGEMRLSGHKNDGRPWNIAIERPADCATADREIQHTVPMTNCAVVTSGNYRKYFEENGQRFSHTISPKTGEPVRDSLLSATVICKEAWEADAMATAFMVMGMENTRRYLSAHPGRYRVYLIYAHSNASSTASDEQFGLWSNVE